MTRSTRNERRVQMEIPDDGVRIDTGYLVKVPVRWSDMDVFQHINHARMVTLIEEARIRGSSTTSGRPLLCATGALSSTCTSSTRRSCATTRGRSRC